MGHDEIGGEGGQEGGRHGVEPRGRQDPHNTLEVGVREAEGAAVVRTYSVTK